KYILQWVPDANVRTASGSTTNRLYAHDSPPLFADRSYLLRVGKDSERAYWVSYRSKYTNNVWSQNGVELHWNNWSLTLGSSQLLDTTPGTPLGLVDAALVVGRTFSDVPAGVHITPIARGASGANAWIDVVVNTGRFPANLAPTLDLTSSADRVVPGAAVNFTATLRMGTATPSLTTGILETAPSAAIRVPSARAGLPRGSTSFVAR